MWYTEPSPQLGILGFGDPLSKYKKKGMSLQAIFSRFSSSLDRYQDIVRRIPSKGTAQSLQSKLDSLFRLRNELAGAFAPGSKPGKRDEERLGELVGRTKSFRLSLKRAMSFYGVRAPGVDIDPGEEESVRDTQQAASAPGWMWAIPAALLYYIFTKKKV